MFRTQYDRVRYTCSSGSPVKEEFIGHYDPDGVLRLEKSGEKNVYEEIQAYKDSADINVILKKYLAGDEAVLNRIQGTYADVSTLPKTYADILNLQIRAEKDFLALPEEIRSRFGNDPTQFIAQLGTESWMKKMQLDQPAAAAAQPEKKEEVSE